MDLVHLVYIFSVKMLFRKYTRPSCSDPNYFKSEQTHHALIFPNFRCSFFIFVKCTFRLLQSSAAPGLSVLHLLRRRYRLTGAAKAAVIQSLCFPWAACDPHHITDSVLHIFFSHDTPPLAPFHPFLLHKGFATIPALDPSFHTCLSDVLIFTFLLFHYYYFRYVCPSCNIML